MKICFYKINNLGNIFVIIYNLKKNIFNKNYIKYLSKYNISIGFDQLILINIYKKSRFILKIFNSDGSYVNQCGNGIICAIFFLYKKKIVFKNEIVFFKINNFYTFSIINNFDFIKVCIGTYKKINIKYKNYININNLYYIKNIISYNFINIVNNHCIFNTNKILKKDIYKFILSIKKYKNFLKIFNLNFIKIFNKNFIKLITYERGSGFTESCGSGACASVIFGINEKLLNNKVKVKFKYGYLIVFYDKFSNYIYLISKYPSYIFKGFINF